LAFTLQQVLIQRGIPQSGCPSNPRRRWIYVRHREPAVESPSAAQHNWRKLPKGGGFSNACIRQAGGQRSLITDLTTRQQQGQRLIERLAVGDESRINQLTTPRDCQHMVRCATFLPLTASTRTLSGRASNASSRSG
jgi:hypothetical protein